MPGQWTTEAMKRLIIADHVAGVSKTDMAAKYKRHPETITRIIRETKRIANDSQAFSAAETYRQRHLKAANSTLHRALETHDDIYKAGALAVQTLKGYGVFTPDGAGVTMNALVMQMPREWLPGPTAGDASDSAEQSALPTATETVTLDSDPDPTDS